MRPSPRPRMKGGGKNFVPGPHLEGPYRMKLTSEKKVINFSFGASHGGEKKLTSKNE